MGRKEQRCGDFKRIEGGWGEDPFCKVLSMSDEIKKKRNTVEQTDGRIWSIFVCVVGRGVLRVELFFLRNNLTFLACFSILAKVIRT
jgi:hypothetical protein